jgi:hypothetical protein
MSPVTMCLWQPDHFLEGGKGTAQMTPCRYCFAPAMKGWRIPRSRQDGRDRAPERMASNPTEFIRVVELVQQFFDNPEQRPAVNSPNEPVWWLPLRNQDGAHL